MSPHTGGYQQCDLARVSMGSRERRSALILTSCTAQAAHSARSGLAVPANLFSEATEMFGHLVLRARAFS